MVLLGKQCIHIFNIDKLMRLFSNKTFKKNVHYSNKHSQNFSLKQELTEEKYIVGSPYPNLEIPNVSYTKLLWDRHHEQKNSKAVECGLTGESYTYSELLEKSKRLGRGLRDVGLEPGDVLAFIMPNMPEYVAALIGASAEGLTISSINPLYTPNEISNQIRSSNAQSIITFPAKLKDVMQAVKDLSNAGVLPSKFKIIISKDFQGKEQDIPSGTIRLTESTSEETNDSSDYLSSDLDKKLAFIAYSSGTTGLPKGVCLSHMNTTSQILQLTNEETTSFIKSTDVVPLVMPIFHNYGLIATLGVLYEGAKLVTVPKFEEKSFFSLIKKHKATMLLSVPPILQCISLSPHVTKEHLESLRCIFTAAAPIGEKDIERMLKKCPSDMIFVQGYGQTEGMCAITKVPCGVKNYKSSGVPLSNTQLKVIDIDTGENLPAFKEGEICFKGPNQCLGYLNNPEANKASFDSRGWFHTGDVGYYDEDSHFYIVDRIKEMIKVKGFQVAPAELEAALRSHPQIEDVGVIGAPHDKKGEEPIGYVKLKPNTSVTPEELRQFLSTKVAPYKLIEKFHFVDSIPKSPAGKILRKDLRK